MKTNVSVVVVAALTQLLGTMLFFEEVSAAYSQRQMIIDRRGASALEQSLPLGGALTDPPGSNPNPHVPTPSHQHNVHSTVEASAAILPVLATCPPASRCSPSVPTPGCCSLQSKEEQQVKVNGKGELMRNYRTSITTAKHALAEHMNTHASADHIRRGPLVDSLAFHTTH